MIQSWWGCCPLLIWGVRRTARAWGGTGHVCVVQAELLKLEKSRQFPDEPVRIKGAPVHYVKAPTYWYVIVWARVFFFFFWGSDRRTRYCIALASLFKIPFLMQCAHSGILNIPFFTLGACPQVCASFESLPAFSQILVYSRIMFRNCWVYPLNRG